MMMMILAGDAPSRTAGPAEGQHAYNSTQCHCCMGLDFWVLESEWPSPSVLILPPCVSYQIVIARDSSECVVGARRCHTAVAMF